jgi:septal ring factor EnvC (AmiA/AmiB activator)
MSKITDILAEVPLSAVLRERLLQAEAEIAAGEKRLAEALVDNEKLRLSLQKAEEEIRVLKERVHLFESDDNHPGFVSGS